MKNKDLLEVSKGAIFTGIGIGVVQASPLQSNVKSGLTGLLGLNLLKETAKKL